MNPLRRSYEARVLVVPLGDEAADLASSMAAQGLEGIRVLSSLDPRDAQTTLVGPTGWQPPTPAGTPEVTTSADMVVLLGTDLADVSEEDVRLVCEAARQGGDLIAAVLVAPHNWEAPTGASAMVTLRQEADMLISVRSSSPVVALLDVLRGGARTPVGPGQGAVA